MIKLILTVIGIAFLSGTAMAAPPKHTMAEVCEWQCAPSCEQCIGRCTVIKFQKQCKMKCASEKNQCVSKCKSGQIY